MEASQVSPASSGSSRTHPMVLVAATSVTILSLAGVATLAGWLPGAGSHGVEAAKTPTASTPAPVAAAPAPVAPATTPATAPVAQDAAKAAAKPSERAVVRHTAPRPAAQAPAPVAGVPPVGTPPPPGYATSAPQLPPVCRDCGVVEAVREVAVEPKGSGGGAVAGGVVGGIIGNQIGKGATRDIATVLGAVGGAYAGNQIEKANKQSKRYDVVVRFQDGTTQTFSSDSPPAWRSGDRVRLNNGVLAVDGGRATGNPGSY